MVKPGYKQTEIGVIPEEWKTILFKNCFDILPNNTLSRAELNNNCGIVKNIHYGDILVKYNSILDSSNTQIPYINNTKKSFSSMYLKDGDIVIADTAEDETVGKAVEITNVDNQKIVAGLHTIPCRVINKEDFSAGWIGYYMNNDIYHHQLLPYITGTKVSAVSKSAISNTVILIPPKKEQQFIANALSDVDGMISSLEKLIAKKKAVKQGAMQELLTGKKRLSRFSGEWINKKIEEIAEVGRGRVISHIEISKNLGGKYPVYSSQTTNNGIMGYLRTFDFDGDYITWTTDGVNAGTVFYRNGKFNCTNVCGTLKCKKDNADFVARRLGIETPKYVATNLANPKLMNDVMKKITITLPPTIEEQNAIASILSDMDNEIEVLEQKLAKTRQLKQGMMQQLLIGKIRLV